MIEIVIKMVMRRRRFVTLISFLLTLSSISSTSRRELTRSSSTWWLNNKCWLLVLVLNLEDWLSIFKIDTWILDIWYWCSKIGDYGITLTIDLVKDDARATFENFKLNIDTWIKLTWSRMMQEELLKIFKLNIDTWVLNIATWIKLTWSRMMQEEELFQSLKLTPHILMTGLHSWTCLEKARNSITGHVWRVWVAFFFLFVAFACLVSNLDWNQILQ